MDLMERLESTDDTCYSYWDNGTLTKIESYWQIEDETLICDTNENVFIDSLTGIYNKQYMINRLPSDINYSRISGLPLSMIMADIDFLKKVNNRCGRGIGDKILIDFSKLISTFIRNDVDWVSRYGGEEFMIILNNTDRKDAYVIAERIRKKLEKTTFQYDDISVNITSSFGVYCITDHNIGFSDLLLKVDKNLCNAKNSGRNATMMNLTTINGLEPVDNYDKAAKLADLTNKINELRDILNQICDTFEENTTSPTVLTVSQYLDELIVEYMREINK